MTSCGSVADTRGVLSAVISGMVGAGFTALDSGSQACESEIGYGVKDKIPAAGSDGAYIGLAHPLPPPPQPHATSRGCAPLSPGYAHSIGNRRNT